MFSDDATPIKGIILKIMENTNHTANTATLDIAFLDSLKTKELYNNQTPTLETLQKENEALKSRLEAFENNEIYKTLYKENLRLEAEIAQKDHIIGEHEDEKLKAQKYERYYFEELTHKLKLSAYFKEIQDKINELKKI